MLQLFKPNNRSILGIDISSTCVKAIEISGKDENRIVEGYGAELLPPTAVDGHTIKDIEAIANCIKQLVVRNHLKSKFAAVSVPDSSVISRVLQVDDGLKDSEIEELILMEADKYIPYPIEEISLDFQILGHSIKNSAMLDVLIVASRSENVTSRVAAITAAGLQVKIVDVESFAIERAVGLLAKQLPALGQDKIVAVIDIGDFFANLFVLRDMKMVFTREEEFGGKQLVDEIASHYGLPYSEALALKSGDKMPTDYAEKVLNPYKETLLLHVKRALQFFFSTSHHSYVDHILLAGGVAKLPDLANLVQKTMNIPTTLANPLEHMHLSNQAIASGIENDSSSLLTACGLALRQVE